MTAKQNLTAEQLKVLLDEIKKKADLERSPEEKEMYEISQRMKKDMEEFIPEFIHEMTERYGMVPAEDENGEPHPLYKSWIHSVVSAIVQESVFLASQYQSGIETDEGSRKHYNHPLEADAALFQYDVLIGYEMAGHDVENWGINRVDVDEPALTPIPDPEK